MRIELSLKARDVLLGSGQRRRCFSLTLSFCLLFAPSIVFASQQTGPVTLVSATNNNGGFGFAVSGSRTTKPACATDDFWVIPAPTSDTSKAIYAEALSALLTGRTVQVVGTGACATQANREDVAYVNIM